jgi:hypothetical protein
MDSTPDFGFAFCPMAKKQHGRYKNNQNEGRKRVRMRF